MEPAGTPAAGWQKCVEKPDISNDIRHFAKLAMKAEAAKFHLVFQAVSSSIRPLPLNAVARNMTYAHMLEPFTEMAAMSQSTSRIGLVCTVCTSFWEPFDLARLASSVDHISGLRFGWNIVSGRHELAAPNPRQESIEHAVRYHRAHNFTEVVLGLWDSYEDDAFFRVPETGYYFDPAEFLDLHHDGKYHKVCGTLESWTFAQDHPVLVQAGSSGDGKAFGAQFAEVIFSVSRALDKAKECY